MLRPKGGTPKGGRISGLFGSPLFVQAVLQIVSKYDSLNKLYSLQFMARVPVPQCLEGQGGKVKRERSCRGAIRIDAELRDATTIFGWNREEDGQRLMRTRGSAIVVAFNGI